VLSLNNQFNAIGQVVGGPPLGAVAGRTSIPIALVVSSGILAPASILFSRLRSPRVTEVPASPDATLAPSTA
jgi:hypothetical protein